MKNIQHITSAKRPRRIVSVWFPRLSTDRILRHSAAVGPFAVSITQANGNRLHCLNTAAEQAGLRKGMSVADARVLCSNLLISPIDQSKDVLFIDALARWAMRYCPWVGLDPDGLVLDITGSAHLMGGEAALLADIRQRLTRSGVHSRIGLADTRGAAWALARYREGVAEPGDFSALMTLPVAALRISVQDDIALQRMGLRLISDLEATPRAPVARRFGPALLLRLDQALGRHPEQISPMTEPPHFAARLTCPEPIGLVADVMAALTRVLGPLCDKLARAGMGAREFRLTLRRVDQKDQTVELRLAAPMRDAARILPLFERGIDAVDAGYGIDQIRLFATRVDHLPAVQIASETVPEGGGLDDLLTRIGTRIGLDNIQRFQSVDSHIPEREFQTETAAYSIPQSGWDARRPRPLFLFPPELLIEDGSGSRPPRRFRWRGMRFVTSGVVGPERISPEWWDDDPAWRSGLRDYWKVETRGGRRLWIFNIPQESKWFVHGEFP